MILVKDIEILKTDMDRQEILSYKPENAWDWGKIRVEDKEGHPVMADVEMTRELVTGRRFVNHRGQEVCIGYSKQAEELIGFPFEVMSKELDQSRQINRELNIRCDVYMKKLDKIENMSFWQRLRFLFKTPS